MSKQYTVTELKGQKTKKCNRTLQPIPNKNNSISKNMR